MIAGTAARAAAQGRSRRAGGAAAVLAAFAAFPHVVEDVDAGVGVAALGTAGAAVAAALLVGALAVLGVVVALARRRPLRSLVAVDLMWATAAVADHPQAFMDVGAFRQGPTSAVPVLLLAFLALLSAGLLVRSVLADMGAGGP